MPRFGRSSGKYPSEPNEGFHLRKYQHNQATSDALTSRQKRLPKDSLFVETLLTTTLVSNTAGSPAPSVAVASDMTPLHFSWTDPSFRWKMSMVLKAASSTRQSIVTHGRFKTDSFCFHPTLRAFLMILTSLYSVAAATR